MRNRARRRKRGWPRAFAALVLIGVAVRFVAPLFGWPPVWKVVVVGCERIHESKIAAMIPRTTSAWSLSGVALEGAIAALPEVERCDVSIAPWGAVSVDVREVRVVAYVAGGELRALASDGSVFALEGADGYGSLPLVFGAKVVGGRIDPAQSYVAAWCDSLLACEPALWSRLGEVRASADRSELVFAGGARAVIAAPPRGRAAEALARTIESLPDGGAGLVLDCRFADQVIVRPSAG